MNPARDILHVRKLANGTSVILLGCPLALDIINEVTPDIFLHQWRLKNRYMTLKYFLFKENVLSDLYYFLVDNFIIICKNYREHKLYEL